MYKKTGKKTNTVDAKELLLLLKQEFLNYIRMTQLYVWNMH